MKHKLQKLGQQINQSMAGSALKRRVDRWFDVYEEYIGVKEVRRTQQNVLKAEAEFTESSKQRRQIHNQLRDLQENLKQIRMKLDTVKRSDEAYIELITNEHKLIKEEMKLMNDLRASEDMERECFGKFSQLLRAAHEIETLRQEKSKYLSLIGSIVGAALGILATSINHARKMKQFKQLLEAVKTDNGQSPVVDESESVKLLQALADGIQSKEEELNAFQESGLSITQRIEEANLKLENILINTNSNLEFKIKMNTIVAVTATYALIAITLPIIIKFFN